VTARSKGGWRSALIAARRLVPPEERARRAALLTRHALALAAEVDGPVAAYLAIGTEPWSVDGPAALRAAGHEVLLPVVTPDGPLDWVRDTGVHAAGPFGLREPVGPRLGPGAIGRCGLLLVPALAADRAGTRLGRGAGHYDRSLPLAGGPAVVVLHDEELVDALPAEPHDVPMAGALLPEDGFVTLGKSG
jgi:5-formyltetrahydrofolate cyclo-ligase